MVDRGRTPRVRSRDSEPARSHVSGWLPFPVRACEQVVLRRRRVVYNAVVVVASTSYVELRGLHQLRRAARLRRAAWTADAATQLGQRHQERRALRSSSQYSLPGRPPWVCATVAQNSILLRSRGQRHQQLERHATSSSSTVGSSSATKSSSATPHGARAPPRSEGRHQELELLVASPVHVRSLLRAA